jgi:hypothetical protein
LFDSDFLVFFKEEEGQPEVINKKSKNHKMLQHTHLETPTPYIQKRPKKSLLFVFSKGINLTIFRRSMPNCGAS